MTPNDLLEQIKLEERMRQPIKRPRLLFLAYYFPPVQASGSVRTRNIARYLARLGWEVTIVTPDPSVWRNVDNCEKVLMELDSEGINRILTAHRWRCLAPDHLNCWNRNLGWFAGGVCRRVSRHLGIEREAGWIKAAERACSTLGPKDVDVILASGSPFGSFRLAKNLSGQLGRPYVLDYRDPWTENPHAIHPPRLATIREEASLLDGSAAVTIVSPSWGAALDRCYGVGAKLHVVTNGYDPDEMAAVKPYNFGHRAIVYTGNFYPPKRVISPVLDALVPLKEAHNENGNRWYFHYYGEHEQHVLEQGKQFGLNDRIVLHGRVPRRDALSAIKGASLAVVITSVDERDSLEDKGTIPAKIFEAIGVGTQVLLISPNSSDATAISATTCLVKSYTGSDIEGMTSFLKDVIYGHAPNPNNTDVLSWITIGRRFDTVLRKAIPVMPNV